ncbi:MAG: TonB-dependent receptor, partial [Opitutaceae bacterium]|nr:TonB-dependent receptor [Cytophagales bacterium]
MKKLYIFIILFLTTINLYAHSSFHGKILDKTAQQPVIGAVIQVLGQNKVTISDVNGYFEIRGLGTGTYAVKISLIGYKPLTDSIKVIDEVKTSQSFLLEEDAINISEITVTANKDVGLNSISRLDFSLRPHLTTQDLLRLVPGLFIAQHAGGGKSEQLFLRGFDVDHGTDVAISVDNMPVNMVSQAHGQGYADLHFVIPETIERMSFSKGPYDAKTGNFNTAGAVRFQTKSYLPRNMIKTEIGRFNTYRGVTMVNLLNNSDTTKHKHNAFVAAEYFYTNGFFDNPQDFSKVNLFGKYTSELNKTTNLSFTLSSFRSKWNASGEIPTRAVQSGLISKFGAIDPSEGGNTSRINANLGLSKKLENHAVIQNNVYYIKYTYNLYSNFTMFKEDTINGDEINQKEERNVLGYNGSYTQEGDIGNVGFKSTIGVGLRDDQIGNIALSHTRNRTFLNDITLGDIHETNFNAYLDETITFSPRL